MKYKATIDALQIKLDLELLELKRREKDTEWAKAAYMRAVEALDIQQNYVNELEDAIGLLSHDV